MNRNLTYLIGPEVVLAVLSAGVFLFCSRHASGEGRDVAIMEKLILLLPWVVVPLVFATVWGPGGKSVGWLVRAVVLSYLMLVVCGGRIIGGFGPGARGQDGAFIIVLMFGTVAVSFATSITCAMIRAEVKPAFARWFAARKVLASMLTLAAAVPIGAVLGVLATLCTGFLLAFHDGLKN